VLYRPVTVSWPKLPELGIKREELFGARGLAWAGGLVTLLGIVFLFVMAVNRGWVGPEIRLAIGAAISAALFAAGLYLRSRYEQLYAAMGCVFAGMAGAFATTVAASLLYGFLPDWGALVAAAGIAAAGVAVSLSWSTQSFAFLGLIGALVAPLSELQNGKTSVVGAAFALLLLVAAGTVGIARGWRALLAVAGPLGAGQVALLFNTSAELSTGSYAAISLAGVCVLLGIAVATGLRSAALGPIVLGYLFGGAALGALAATQLFDGTVDRGYALLIVGALYGAVGTLLLRRSRDLGALTVAVALAIAAAAVGAILDGHVVTVVWAAEAAVLAWLAGRVGERRYRLASLGYLAAAAIHALFGEASPAHLFLPSAEPGGAVPAVVYVGVAAAAFGLFLRGLAKEREPSGGAIARALDEAALAIERNAAAVRSAAFAVAAAFGTYALALTTLQLFQSVGTGTEIERFQWGHVAIAGLLGVIALAALIASVRRRSLATETFAWAGLAATLLEAVVFGLAEQPRTAASFGFLAAGVPVLAYGLVFQRSRVRDSPAAATVCVELASLGLFAAAIVDLVDGTWNGVSLQGAALVGLAAAYGGLSVIEVRRVMRDHATLLWASALAVLTAALVDLLDGSLLVLLFAAAAAGCALLGRRLHESRFELAGTAYAALAIGHAVITVAPPSGLFLAKAEPAAGSPALLYAAVGVVALVLFARSWTGAARAGGAAIAAVLSLYACSLGVLGLFQAVEDGTVQAAFTHAQTAVSGLWGFAGLAVLCLGLVRRSRELRLGGLAVLAASLGKIFLFDLANLGPMTRVLSFLAVGLVLLAAGFLYQRLIGRSEAVS
jgi:uncharacterized membrane protein